MKKNLVICLGLSILAHYSHQQMIVVVDDDPGFPFQGPEPFLEPGEMIVRKEDQENLFIQMKKNKHKPKWQKK